MSGLSKALALVLGCLSVSAFCLSGPSTAKEMSPSAYSNIRGGQYFKCGPGLTCPSFYEIDSNTVCHFCAGDAIVKRCTDPSTVQMCELSSGSVCFPKKECRTTSTHTPNCLVFYGCNVQGTCVDSGPCPEKDCT